MPTKLLQEVADYCWSKNFLDIFRNFFTEHAEVFEDAPTLTSGEHDMKYYSLFTVYLKLYERTLESYLSTLDVTTEEFYRDVRDAQNETEDPYLQTFVDCLLASADYESFYKVMSREGSKSAARKAMGGAGGKSAAPKSAVDAKADSKGGSGGGDGGDSKGGGSAAAISSPSSSAAGAKDVDGGASSPIDDKGHK